MNILSNNGLEAGTSTIVRRGRPGRVRPLPGLVGNLGEVAASRPRRSGGGENEQALQLSMQMGHELSGSSQSILGTMHGGSQAWQFAMQQIQDFQSSSGSEVGPPALEEASVVESQQATPVLNAASEQPGASPNGAATLQREPVRARFQIPRGSSLDVQLTDAGRAWFEEELRRNRDNPGFNQDAGAWAIGTAFLEANRRANDPFFPPGAYLASMLNNPRFAAGMDQAAGLPNSTVENVEVLL